MKNKIKIISILLAAVLCFSGCARQSSTEDTSDEIGVTEESTTTSELADGQIYVLHDGVYNPLYVGAASFDTADNSTTDTSRILWFSADDWEEIPTFYSGDSLIYTTSSDFDEVFYIERFEYVGWSFGVAALEETVSGRYAYSGGDTSNMDTSSSASSLLLGEDYTVIIDTVGETELRSANIDDGGIILGLAEGLTYKVEAYTGTVLNELSITADRIVLRSMDNDEISDYVFDHGTTVTIQFPEDYNSGYYAINGCGIFRYVNGDSYDENTDFNIANVSDEYEEESSEEEANEEDDTNDYEESEGLTEEEIVADGEDEVGVVEQ